MTLTTGRSARLERRSRDAARCEIACRAQRDRCPDECGRRGWGQRFAARLVITDLVALLWAAAGVLSRVDPAGPGSAAIPTYLPYLLLTAGLVA